MHKFIDAYYEYMKSQTKLSVIADKKYLITFPYVDSKKERRKLYITDEGNDDYLIVETTGESHKVNLKDWQKFGLCVNRLLEIYPPNYKPFLYISGITGAE